MNSSRQSRSGLRLAIAGVGALGSELCLRLAEWAGEHAFTEVLVVDPDLLHPENLPLSRLFRSVAAQDGCAISSFKADLLAALLNGSSPMRWMPIPTAIADVGWQILGECDLLVCCADNALARMEMALVRRSLHLPMLDGAVQAEGLPEGRVSWFPSEIDAACYLCGIAEARRAEMLAFGLAPTLGCAAPVQPQAMSSLPAVAPAIGETAAAMLRMIAGFPRLSPASASAQRLLARDHSGSDWVTKTLRLSRSASCPWHGGDQRVLIPLDDSRPVRDAIPGAPETSPPWRLEFPWPVCVEARCRTCGFRQPTAQRLALLRSAGGCSGCGAVALDPLRCIGSLSRNDPDAAKTPRQLGLPERHLYFLRRTILAAGRGRGDREASA